MSEGTPNTAGIMDHERAPGRSRISAYLPALLDTFRLFKSKKVRPQSNSIAVEPRVMAQLLEPPSPPVEQLEFAILNAIPVAVCVTNLSGRISYRNPEFSASIDIEESVVNIFEAFPESEAAQVSENLFLAQTDVVASVLLTKQKAPTVGEELLNYSWTFASTSNGRTIVLTGKPLSRDPMGHLSTSECEDLSNQLLKGQFMQDMTAAVPSSKHSELEPYLSNNLQNFAIKVQQKAEHASSQREREILVQSRRETMELKRMFVRHIGHEIRSPLNAMLNGLHMLGCDEEGLSEDSRVILSDTEIACRNAVEIMDDLLIYEKLDSQSLSLDYSLFDLIELVNELIELLQLQARHSSITLEVKMPTIFASIMVHADRNRISQAFRNMITDALKFTPLLGKVSVALTMNELRSKVRFEVHDGGDGLSKERRIDLFQKPSHFDPTQLHADQGSGLGYLVIRGIVEKHGGEIGVCSDWIGIGSKFFVELNVASFTAATGDVSSAALPDERGSPKGSTKEKLSEKLSIRSLRLLIVDDVVSCRKIHKKLLSPFCSEIIEASDGQEAVEIVRRNLEENRRIHGIIMDNAMPKMNGMMAAKKIRELGFKGRIVGVTGNAFDNEVEEFQMCGADEVMIKPVDQNRYEAMVKSFV